MSAVPKDVDDGSSGSSGDGGNPQDRGDRSDTDEQPDDNQVPVAAAVTADHHDRYSPQALVRLFLGGYDLMRLLMSDCPKFRQLALDRHYDVEGVVTLAQIGRPRKVLYPIVRYLVASAEGPDRLDDNYRCIPMYDDYIKRAFSEASVHTDPPTPTSQTVTGLPAKGVAGCEPIVSDETSLGMFIFAMDVAMWGISDGFDVTRDNAAWVLRQMPRDWIDSILMKVLSDRASDRGRYIDEFSLHVDGAVFPLDIVQEITGKVMSMFWKALHVERPAVEDDNARYDRRRYDTARSVDRDGDGPNLQRPSFDSRGRYDTPRSVYRDGDGPNLQRPSFDTRGRDDTGEYERRDRYSHAQRPERPERQMGSYSGRAYYETGAAGSRDDNVDVSCRPQRAAAPHDCFHSSGSFYTSPSVHTQDGYHLSNIHDRQGRRITVAERDAMKRQGRCFNCGGQGHTSQACSSPEKEFY